MAISRTAPLSLETVESLLAEVTEYYGRYEKLLEKLHRLWALGGSLNSSCREPTASIETERKKLNKRNKLFN